MTDTVYDFGSASHFEACARGMGLWREAQGDEPGGPVVYGNGYFMNVCGPVDGAGYWARLRWLRDDPIPPTPPGVVEYPEGDDQPQVGMIA